jgi:uncharacterized protein YraI
MLYRRAPFVAAAMLVCIGQAATVLAAEASIAIVDGVADGDLLNLRENASPAGKIKNRLPNGTSLARFGCQTVNGYEWCEVEDTENPGMRGWVPARYLRDIGEIDYATGSPEPDSDTTQQAGLPSPESGDDGDGSMTHPSPTQMNAPVVPPADLAARFGDTPATGVTGDKAAAVRKALQHAYGLASASGTADEDAVPSSEGGDTGPDLADVPVPTPRPGREEAEWQAPATVAALAQDPASVAASQANAGHEVTGAPSAGTVPCARYVGQPMTQCAAVVSRMGNDAAEVTVAWPDGGTRIISFRDGKPAGADSGGEFRYTREGSLNMIRIGPSERFEITDALPFGK